MKKRFVLFIVLFLIGCLLIFNLPVSRPFFKSSGITNIPFGEITPDKAIIQTLPADKDYILSGLKILLATYARTNTGTIVFHLFLNKNEVYTKIISSEKIDDNSWYYLKNIDININAGDHVELMISSPDSESGNAITAWTYSDSGIGGLYQYNPNADIRTLMNGSLSFIVVESTANSIDLFAGHYSNNTIIIVTTTLCLLTLLILLSLLFTQLLFRKEEVLPNEANYSNSLPERG